MKRWIATAVDTSDSADGKARVIGVFKTEDEARNYVKLDMEDWIGDHSYGSPDLVDSDFITMHANCGYGEIACEWNVEEFDIE